MQIIIFGFSYIICNTKTVFYSLKMTWNNMKIRDYFSFALDYKGYATARSLYKLIMTTLSIGQYILHSS